MFINSNNPRTPRARRKSIDGQHSVVFPRSGRDRDVIFWAILFAFFAALLYIIEWPWAALPMALVSVVFWVLIWRNPKGALTLRSDRITWCYEAFHEGSGEVELTYVLAIDIDDHARSHLKLKFEDEADDLIIPIHADVEELFESLKEMYPEIEIAFELDDL